MNDNGTPIDIEDVMAGLGNSEAHRLANDAMFAQNQAKRIEAAESLLEKANEFTFWLNHIMGTGILDSRIKKEVAWPVVISRQSKDPRFHKTVLDTLKARGLGVNAPTGRNDTSGGKKQPADAREMATTIDGIISGIHLALQSEKQGSSICPKELDFSHSDGYFRSILKTISNDDLSEPLFHLIKELKAVKPSAELWKKVGQHVLLYLRPDLKPEKQGRTKEKTTALRTQKIKSNRRLRSAVRLAYIDLANDPEKSRNF